jgi:hypothetical protein
MFLGDGASDCGTLTIRCAARPLKLVLLNLLGVERGGGGVNRRGALLGPEGSGHPGNRLDRFFWVTCCTCPFWGGCGGVAGAGLHQTAGGDV